MSKRSTKKRMRSSYKKDFQYFSIPREPKELSEYYSQLLKVDTIDLRNDSSNAKEIILNSINNSTFILIDGPSMSGKTTFSKRLSKLVDAEIIDADILSMNYFVNLVSKEASKKGLSKEQTPMLIQNYSMEEFHKITDDYILNNLEKLVKEVAENNKPLILVGAYNNMISRSVIFKTLANKYFDQTISIYCCEKDSTKILELYKSRIKDFNMEFNEMNFRNCLTDFELGKTFIETNYLGLGTTFSYVINSEISNNFI